MSDFYTSRGLFTHVMRAVQVAWYMKEGRNLPLAAYAGLLAFDALGGFWLLHSVPRFPSAPSQGGYTGALFLPGALDIIYRIHRQTAITLGPSCGLPVLLWL